jgi:SAM-dependent methyltransferase
VTTEAGDAYGLPMASREPHALGFERVDDHPHVPVLLDTMGQTARWQATIGLRAWEREQLHLTGGQRLLDIGCGLGEAALALADDLSDHGEVVGVDRSSEMLRAARERVGGVRCQVRFTLGEACALDEPDDSYDVVRCERTLQWITNPLVAIAEMARVVRPGGLVSLIDTDWSTFSIDVGDDDVARRVRLAMQNERGRPSNIGARLPELAAAAGLDVLARTHATQVWTEWDPDVARAPDGCFSIESLADDLVATGQLDATDRDRFVAVIHDGARRGQFSMALTMHAVVAAAPAARADRDQGVSSSRGGRGFSGR